MRRNNTNEDPPDYPDLKILFQQLDVPWGSEEHTRKAYLRFLKRLSIACPEEAKAAGVRFEPLEEAEARGEVVKPGRRIRAEDEP